MIIRNAKPGDLDTLINLGEELHKVEKQFEPLLKYSKDESRKRYLAEFQNPDASFWLAVEGGEILGYSYAHLDFVDYLLESSKQCEIEVVYVKPDYRGKGVAAKLVEECTKWAESKNVFRIVAGIYFDNMPSTKLFEKAGFKPHHTTFTKNVGK